MGCGYGKVVPEGSKNSYVTVLQSLMAFTRASEEQERPKKKVETRFWFGKSNEKLQQRRSQTQTRDTRQNKPVRTYRDKFDPRVTARYHIQALIGRGSFSRVVRAQHRGSHQPYAIKMMEVEFPEGREVCTAELTALKRVRHPNIVRLVEVFQLPHRVYMVLELATGGELLDRIVSKGYFTERDATKAIKMVLAAVSYLHGLGIAHRDLKPDNLLYYHPGADSKLLVTDFGLASFVDKAPDHLDGTDCASVDTSCSLRSSCGTPEYAAPEVWQKKPWSRAVDMWALGVVTFVVLSGSLPFEDDSRTRLFKTVTKGKYNFSGDPWPCVSNLAKHFVSRLLCVDPCARLTADRALLHPWVASEAPTSSSKNLHRPISQNIRQRASRGGSGCHSNDSSDLDLRERRHRTQTGPTS